MHGKCWLLEFNWNIFRCVKKCSKKLVKNKTFLKILLSLYLFFSGKVNASKGEIFSKNYITSLFSTILANNFSEGAFDG